MKQGGPGSLSRCQTVRPEQSHIPRGREGEPSVVRDTSGLLDMEGMEVNIENIENDEIDSFSDGGEAGCHSAASLGN